MRVLPFLHIGQTHECAFVLNLADVYVEADVHVPLPDRAEVSVWESCFEIIKQHQHTGVTLLGEERAVALAIAYLVKHEQWTLQDATEHLMPMQTKIQYWPRLREFAAADIPIDIVRKFRHSSHENSLDRASTLTNRSVSTTVTATTYTSEEDYRRRRCVIH